MGHMSPEGLMNRQQCSYLHTWHYKVSKPSFNSHYQRCLIMALRTSSPSLCHPNQIHICLMAPLPQPTMLRVQSALTPYYVYWAKFTPQPATSAIPEFLPASGAELCHPFDHLIKIPLLYYFKENTYSALFQYVPLVWSQLHFIMSDYKPS